MKKSWELKQEADDPEVLDMFIYDNVQGDYVEFWTWEKIESETSANFFREQLNKYPDVKQINVYVNSYGGSVYEAMAIRSQLKRHPAQVIGIVDGFACSAAAFILTACDIVKMYSNTMQMIHLMWDHVTGNYMELRKAADDLEKISIGNRQAWLEKSGGKITEEELLKIMENKVSQWLTAQECLDYGFADEIIAEEVDLTQAKQMLQKVNESLEQKLTYNKALAAQLRQLNQMPIQEQNDPDPDPETNQEPVQKDNDLEPQENKPKNLLMALFAKKEEN